MADVTPAGGSGEGVGLLEFKFRFEKEETGSEDVDFGLEMGIRFQAPRCMLTVLAIH